MSMYSSLLDLAEELATDPATKADYARDPEGFLAERGLDQLAAEDLDTALEHVADALPVELSRQLTPDPGREAGDALGRLAEVEPAGADADLDFGAGEVAEDLDDGDDLDDDEPAPTLSDADGADDAGTDGIDPEAGSWSGEASAELSDAAGDGDGEGDDLDFGQGVDDADADVDDLPDDLPDA